MYVFIWNNVKNLTDSFHSGGGAVIIESSLEAARQLVAAGYTREIKLRRIFPEQDPTLEEYLTSTGPQYETKIIREDYVVSDSDIYTQPPDITYKLIHNEQNFVLPAVFIFPDAGCC